MIFQPRSFPAGKCHDFPAMTFPAGKAPWFSSRGRFLQERVGLESTHNTPARLWLLPTPLINLGHSGWKDWELHLWHASSYQPLATCATIFRLILISSATAKTPPRSGGLNFVTL
jgi:hypothetical protein